MSNNAGERLPLLTAFVTLKVVVPVRHDPPPKDPHVNALSGQKAWAGKESRGQVSTQVSFKSSAVCNNS